MRSVIAQRHFVVLQFALVLLRCSAACGEEPTAALPLADFRPQSALKVKSHLLARAKFPVVDVHTHFRYKLRPSKQELDRFVQLMDRHHIAVCVSMDGRLSSEFEEHRDFLWNEHRDRFLIFANINWRGDGKPDDHATWDCHRPDFARRMVAKLKEVKRLGASGLKLFKRFGLSYRNPDGSLMAIDDPRWDLIWHTCGELQLPVLIHTADPAAFFQPINARNERWEELSRHPDWSFHGDDYPSREQLLTARNNVIEKHPKTVFIGAHFANNPEDLDTVSRWLDQYPNLYVELASRIGELGRQPYTSRRFFIRYQRRILFGTDGPWPEERIRLYWRFLETFDEYFPYSEKPFPPQGFWNIYGIGLPDETLRRVYHENAVGLFPGLKERLTKYNAKLKK